MNLNEFVVYMLEYTVDFCSLYHLKLKMFRFWMDFTWGYSKL